MAETAAFGFLTSGVGSLSLPRRQGSFPNGRLRLSDARKKPFEPDADQTAVGSRERRTVLLFSDGFLIREF